MGDRVKPCLKINKKMSFSILKYIVSITLYEQTELEQQKGRRRISGDEIHPKSISEHQQVCLFVHLGLMQPR